MIQEGNWTTELVSSLSWLLDLIFLFSVLGLGTLPMALAQIVWIDCCRSHSADALESVASRSSKILTRRKSYQGLCQNSGPWQKLCRMPMCIAQKTIATFNLVASIHTCWDLRVAFLSQISLRKSTLLAALRTPEVKQTVGPRSKGRRKWFLLGHCVSPKCFVGLLGIGNGRVQRILDGKWDMRRSWGIVARKLRKVSFPSSPLLSEDWVVKNSRKFLAQN